MKTKTIRTNKGKERTIKVPSRTNPLTVRISRKKWWRGNGSFGSALLKSGNGKMCCLGFDALALGLKRADILGLGSPMQAGEIPGLVDTSGCDNIKCHNMMSINDDNNIDEELREKQLTALAKKVGRKFVFVP